MSDNSTIVTVLREPLFVADTPYELTPRVALYHDTWTDHVPLERKLPGVQAVTMSTLSSPSVVVQGTTVPHYVAFVNQSVTSQNTQSPFVVFVDPTAEPMPAVAGLGYRQDFRELAYHTVLWLPSPT